MSSSSKEKKKKTSKKKKSKDKKKEKKKKKDDLIMRYTNLNHNNNNNNKNEQQMKIKKISIDDYYMYSVEYREWLRKSKGIYFEDLSSVESKEKFVSFIKRWNKGKLGIDYYNGKIKEKDDGRRRTKFNWNIKSSTHSSALIK